MAEQIEITITPKGETTVKVLGFMGEGCKEFSANIEKALGSVTADEPTAEMKEVKSNVGITNRA